LAEPAAKRRSAVVLCPSADPSWSGSVAIGIVGGTVAEPRVGYLVEPMPVTEQLLSLTEPIEPSEVLRFAAPCAGDSCQHFDGHDCRLISKVVALLPSVVTVLPPCKIRRGCRWWLQEGRAACMRCPQVVTDNKNPSEAMTEVSDPTYVL